MIRLFSKDAIWKGVDQSTAFIECPYHQIFSISEPELPNCTSEDLPESRIRSRKKSMVTGRSMEPRNSGSSISSRTPFIRETLPVHMKQTTAKRPNHLETPSGRDATKRGTRGTQKNNISERKRPPSGLFDIIYDQTPTKPAMPTAITSRHLRSPSYMEIERAILSGHVCGGDRSSPHAPTVTMIDEKNLRRTGSVVSHDAGLRNRNTIKRRNKMKRRETRENNSTSVSSVVSADPKLRDSKHGERQRSRGCSLFPVRRRTSFKFYPVRKAENKTRFAHQNDVDEYFLLNNITSLMKDILPSRMAIYNFKGIQRINPPLTSRQADFSISNEAQFTEFEPRVGASATSRVAFEDSSSHKIPHGSDFVFQERNTEFENSDRFKRRSFLETVYSNYRRISFAGKRPLPLRMKTVLPLECEMMTKTEQEALDIQILLEVLLRRTVAAKIKFRLDKQSRRQAVSQASLKSSSSTSSSDFTSLDPKSRRINRTAANLSKRKRNDHRDQGSISSKSDQSRIDRISSSFSEALPSPQISLASNNFDFRPQNPLLPRSTSRGANSVGRADSRMKLPFAEHETSSRNFDYAINPERFLNTRFSSWEGQVHEGNFERESGESAGVMRSLGNVDLAFLKPMNRSHETLSSASFTNFELYRREGANERSVYTERAHSYSRSSSASGRHIRTSKSTANTSLLRESKTPLFRSAATRDDDSDASISKHILKVDYVTSQDSIKLENIDFLGSKVLTSS